MKLKKYKSMHEAVEVSDIDYSTMDHVMAGAYRESEELKKRAEKAMEDRKLEMPNEDIEAHKDIKSDDMKKMHLCESFFEEFISDEDLTEATITEAAYTDEHIQYIEDSYKAVCKYYTSVEAVVDAFRSEAELMDASEVIDDIAITLREKIESVSESKKEDSEGELLTEYKRQEGSKLVYKQKRDSLAEIIQVELTEGEWGYVENPDGSTSPTRLPSANYLDDKIGVVFGRDDSCSIRIWAKDEEALQPAVDIAKKYGKDYKVGSDKYVQSEDKFYCDIFLTEEDWEGHYFDPNVPVAKSEKPSKKKVEELEEDIKEDNTDIETKEECIHPSEEIEESIEDVEKEILTEARISTEGLRNFRPWDGAVNTYQRIVEAKKLDTLEFMLEDMYPNGVGANELNDMLQFESDWILESLGLIEKTDDSDDDIYETVIGPDGNPMKKLKETI